MLGLNVSLISQFFGLGNFAYFHMSFMLGQSNGFKAWFGVQDVSGTIVPADDRTAEREGERRKDKVPLLDAAPAQLKGQG